MQLVCLVVNALFLQAINIGVGRHISTLPKAQIQEIAKLVFIDQWLFALDLMLIKFSALAFLARIFDVSRRFKIACRAVAFFNFAFFIFTVSYTLRCKPTERAWNPYIPGSCEEYGTFVAGYWVSGIWDALLDILILVLPLPMLWRLHMKPARRWLLIATFFISYRYAFSISYQNKTRLMLIAASP